MTNKIMAVALIVSDMQKAIEFYRDKLELNVKSEEEGFAELETEGTTLALLTQGAVDGTNLAGGKFRAETQTPRPLILAWDAVEDVDQLYQDLRSKGVEFVQEPTTTDWGQRVAYFSDPDGNIWEISQWVKQEE